MHTNKKWNDQQTGIGFTLLEVLVSISVIAIVVTAVLRMQSQTLKMSFDTQFNIVAPMLARMKLSEFELKNGAVTQDEGDFGDAYPGYQYTAVVEKTVSEVLGEKGAEPLRKIGITVRLENDSEEQAYSLEAYRIFEQKTL